jgi:hypothetical protein
MECKFCYRHKDDNGDALPLFEVMEDCYVCLNCCKYHGMDYDMMGRVIE